MSDSSHSKPHSALMDEIYRGQRHIYDVTRKFYLLGRDEMLRELKVPKSGSILEIACGTGRNLVLAHKKYPDAELYGLDISSEMLVSADKSLKKNGIETEGRLALADACRFNPKAIFKKSGFDRIIISYAVSMIPVWEQAVHHASKQLNEGGELWIVDFGQQSRLPHWFKTLLHAWLAKFHVTPRANLEAVMAEAASSIGGTYEIKSLYRDYARLGVIRR